MFSINNLTPRQTEIIDFLQELRRKGKNLPTYREIADHFGLKSPKAAADHVCALEKKGYVRRRKGRSCGIELLFSEKPSANGSISVPLLGYIPAGYPETKSEYQHGTLAVDPAILGGDTGHKLFALRVNGESMTERGILEGDWVVADADVSP